MVSAEPEYGGGGQAALETASTYVAVATARRAAAGTLPVVVEMHLEAMAVKAPLEAGAGAPQAAVATEPQAEAARQSLAVAARQQMAEAAKR